MIRYISYKNIDKNKWDRCIDVSWNGNIFSYSWYLDSVCDHWDALVEDDYKAVFPLPWASKMNIHHIFQPFFSRSSGVFSKESYSSIQVIEFFDLIPGKFKYINLGFENYPDLQIDKFKVTPRVYQSIDLSPGYASIQSSYSGNLKRNIKKGEVGGLFVRPELNPVELINLFRTNKGGELNIFKEENYNHLLILMKTCIAKNKGEAIGVYNKEGLLCAAAFFMRSHKRIVYLKGATSEQGRKAGAMHFLFDQYFKEASKKADIFDFGGSMVKSVAWFFKSFGAVDTPYLLLNSNRLPWPIKFLKS